MARLELKEADIQNQIIGWLETKGIFHWRSNTGAMRQTSVSKKTGLKRTRFIQFNAPGCPDILCLFRGYLIGIEVKRPGGKPTPAQKRFLANINQHGGIPLIADNLDVVVDLFRSLSR